MTYRGQFILNVDSALWSNQQFNMRPVSSNLGSITINISTNVTCVGFFVIAVSHHSSHLFIAINTDYFSEKCKTGIRPVGMIIVFRCEICKIVMIGSDNPFEN